LPNGQFDILVLTESVPRYPLIIDETYEYAGNFVNYALDYNPATRIYLYEVWHCLDSGTPTGCDYDVDASPWRQRLEDDLPMWQAVVDHLNSEFELASPVCLIPAGQGLARLHDAIDAGTVPELSSIEDLFSDRIHLNDVGKYFVAAIHFSILHRESPVGLTNQLQVWWGGDFDAPSPALAAAFQDLAWEVANDETLACSDDGVFHDDFHESSGASQLAL
jgi:hypothetical protein